jgi:glutathione S-transferase
VALLLQALRQPWVPVHVPFADFAAGITRSDAWRAEQNAMGEVPILDTGSERLTQSAAIMIWLAEKHGAYRGDTGSERQDVLRWLFFDNHKFTSYFATLRFLKSFMPTAPDPTLMKFFAGRVDNAFGIVEKHLAGREYIVGGAPTIADMSLAGYLWFPPEESGYDIPGKYPAMAKWLGRLEKLPGWKPPYEMQPGERVAPRW